jgi:hypothetical protein
MVRPAPGPTSRTWPRFGSPPDDGRRILLVYRQHFLTLPWLAISRALEAIQVDVLFGQPLMLRATTAMLWRRGGGWRHRSGAPTRLACSTRLAAVAGLG